MKFHLILFFVILFTSSCAQVKNKKAKTTDKSLKKDGIVVDYFNPRNEMLKENDKSKLDCFIIYMKKYNLKLKNIEFIVHGFDEKITYNELKESLKMKNIILLYLAERDSAFLNTYHHFNLGESYQKKVNRKIDLEVQIIYDGIVNNKKYLNRVFDFSICK